MFVNDCNLTLIVSLNRLNSVQTGEELIHALIVSTDFPFCMTGKICLKSPTQTKINVTPCKARNTASNSSL